MPILFQRPVEFEDQKPFGPTRFPLSPAPARAGLGALGAWEDFLANTVKSVGTVATDVLGAITGQTAAQAAQEQAIRAAQAAREAEVKLVEARSAAFSKSIPWIAVGGALGLVGLAFALRKK